MMTLLGEQKPSKHSGFLVLCIHMKELLKNLGLTPNEMAVYQALIKMGGSSPAGEVIKLTDLHRNIVYDALTHLKNKGLLQEIKKDGKKFFKLKNPEHLALGFTNQASSIKSLSKIISSLSGSIGHEVTIHEGSTAWQEAWQGIMAKLKPNSVFYTIGMAGDAWVGLMGETFIAYEQWALKNKITDKIISQKYLQKEIEAHQDIKFRDIKYVDIDLLAHTSIEIFDDKCFFEIYDTPETLIEIKSSGLAKSLRAYFELLWVVAKK